MNWRMEKSFSLSFELLFLRDAKREDKDKEEGREKNSKDESTTRRRRSSLSLSLYLPKYIYFRA